MKLIIDIPEERYKRIVKAPRCVDFNEAVEDRTELVKALQNGIPLDDVKAEIEQMPIVLFNGFEQIDRTDTLEIIDKRIGDKG